MSSRRDGTPSAAEHVRRRAFLANRHGLPPGQLNALLGPPGQAKRRGDAWDALVLFTRDLPRARGGRRGRG